MKKIFWRILGVVSLGGIFFFAYILHLHHKGIDASSPYSLEELHALSAVLDPPGSPGMVLPEGLPTRFNSVLSEEELEKEWSLDGRITQSEYVDAWVNSLELQIEDGMAQLQGRPSRHGVDTAGMIGSEKLQWMGDLKSARRYLWAAVDAHKTTEPEGCKYALWLLSAIETDPEKAAMLMHLSLQGTNTGDSPRSLYSAYRLCNMRKSPEWADYYLVRFWAENPEKAKEYEIKGRIPKREVNVD